MLQLGLCEEETIVTPLLYTWNTNDVGYLANYKE